MNKKPAIWQKEQVVKMRDRFIDQHRRENIIELEYMARSIQTEKFTDGFDAATMYVRATGIMKICQRRLSVLGEEMAKITDVVENTERIMTLHDSIVRHRMCYDTCLKKMKRVMSANTVFFADLR